MTAYNRTAFLKHSLGSILTQNLKEIKIEIIIISNFDFQVDVNRENVRITKIIMQGTIGEYLHRGIEESSGDLIAFLDDDDLWENDKLKRVVEVFSDEKIVFYHNMYSYIDSQGKPIEYVRKVERNNKNYFSSELIFNPIFNMDKLKLGIKMKADFNLSCIAIRKSLVLNYIDVLKMITSCQDEFFFWIAIISRGYLFIDNKCLTEYRVHNLNVSGTKNLDHKVTELQKEIMTFDLLINMIMPNSYENNYTKEIKKWLELYKYEYQIMMLVFSDGGKLTILNNIILLIRTGIKKWNILKGRVILFGIIGLISYRVTKSIYIKIK